MAIPFTSEQFFGVFARYNTETWPAPVVLTVAGWSMVILAGSGTRLAGRIVTFWLGLLWLWMGIVYHVGYFRAVNPVAIAFGAAFILQGLLLIRAGVRNQITYAGPLDERTDTGTAALLYALVLYPWIGLAIGHRYPATPTFGLPCPSTIYTLGLLLWSSRPVPLTLLLVPAAWTIVGAWGAIAFGVWQDLGLLAVLGLTTIAVGRRRPSRSVSRAAPPEQREHGAEQPHMLDQQQDDRTPQYCRR